MYVRCYEIVGIRGDYSRHPTDKRSVAYQKLPPARAELAGMGPKSEKSFTGAVWPEAFSM